MLKGRLNLIQACRKSKDMISQAHELDQLYSRAVDSIGEGELQTGILEMAIRAIQDEKLKEEVFATDESMLSFFCGIWIQFLLVEIAGVNKERLQDLARKVFQENKEKERLH